MYSYYLSQFPDALYNCRPERREKLWDDIIRGYDLMKKKTLLVCGLARDIESQLPKTIARINFLASLFQEVVVLIFENDSVDNTVKIIKQWRSSKKNPPNITISLMTKAYGQKRFSDRSLNRSEQMAFCRNKLRDFSFEYKDWADFVCLMDLDLDGGFSYNGIASTFGQLSKLKWDFVGSNSVFYRVQDNQRERLFYDTWAYRPLKKWYLYGKQLDENNLLRFDFGEPMVRVNCCFGGMGFYRTESWFCHDVCYSSVNAEGKNDCDHVTLHQQIWSRGFKRHFLNPSQITVYSDMGYR